MPETENCSTNTVPEAVAPEVPETGSYHRPKISRRTIIILASVAAGIVTFALPFASNLLPRRPRRRNGRKIEMTSVELAEGFYSRKLRAQEPLKPNQASIPRRRVIQYVGADKKVRFVSRFNEKDRVITKPADLTSNDRYLHVAYSRASVFFELAALERIKATQYEAACVHLLNGVRHDLVYKKSIAGAPSLRLWDLLAIVAVRRGQRQHLESLLAMGPDASALIADQHVGPPVRRKRSPRPQDNRRQERQDELKRRLEKWQRDEWRSEIANLDQVMTWTVTLRRDKSSKENINVPYEL